MTGDPVRVLHVVRIMNRAGIETWLMHLLRYFDRREVALDFMVHAEGPGDYDEEIRSLGGKILRCASTRRPWQYSRDFLRHLRENGPYDVVQSHNYFFSGFDLWLATRGGVRKRISHLHPVRDIESNRPLRDIYRRWMGRWIRKYSDLILAPSQASLDAFSKFADLGNKPQAVVRNCVNTAAFERSQKITRRDLGLPADGPVVVYIARFEPHKNHAMLVDLADGLIRMGVRAHFAVAGSEGSTRRAFEQRIEGRTDFSVFVNQPDLVPLLCCADLFFFPSTEEGFGVVAIEAAAAGLPFGKPVAPGSGFSCLRRVMWKRQSARCTGSFQTGGWRTDFVQRAESGQGSSQLNRWLASCGESMASARKAGLFGRRLWYEPGSCFSGETASAGLPLRRAFRTVVSGNVLSPRYPHSKACDIRHSRKGHRP
jgi:glycosyltransferase involved in cell wall biosynthesis